jgi:hypothetical protein
MVAYFPEPGSLNYVFLKAVKEGNLVMVNTLLGFGADPNLRAGINADSSVLMIAYLKGYWEIAELLIHWGAKADPVYSKGLGHLFPSLDCSF